jgi:hypothetical protein
VAALVCRSVDYENSACAPCSEKDGYQTHQRESNGEKSKETEPKRETPEESQANALPDEEGGSGLCESSRGQKILDTQAEKRPMNETSNPDQPTQLTLTQVGQGFQYLAYAIALMMILVVVGTAKNR